MSDDPRSPRPPRPPGPPGPDEPRPGRPPRENLHPPRDPIFEHVARPRARFDAAAIARLKKQLPSLVAKLEGGRNKRFYPYLLVRSFAGTWAPGRSPRDRPKAAMSGSRKVNPRPCRLSPSHV